MSHYLTKHITLKVCIFSINMIASFMLVRGHEGCFLFLICLLHALRLLPEGLSFPPTLGSISPSPAVVTHFLVKTALIRLSKLQTGLA